MTKRWMPVAAAMALTTWLAAPAVAHEHGDEGTGGGGGPACCEAGEACCDEGGACCEAAPGGGGGACCEGMGGESSACCPAEGGKAGHGHHGMKGRWHGMAMGMMARRMSKNAEVRYMPAGYNGNHYLVVGAGPQARMTDWFSIGFQQNLAVQLFPSGPAGSWAVPYWGWLPKLSYSLGNARAELGTLLGLGAMLRTAGANGDAGDFLQARFMWVLEPRAEIGWYTDGWGVSLLGTYMLNPNMGEFGGPTVGVNLAMPLRGW